MDDRLLDSVGRAYGRKPGTPDPVLTQVGPGTPGGELLRRYWQPVALSSEATQVPRLVRRFGEELILFRNGQGEVGLLYPRCAHRGTSLFYGKVEEDGIRCCFHGWKFGPQGVCLDQPCEPEGGRTRHNVRQPWYPVLEAHGAIFAYMGPPDRQPLFPLFSCFEDMTGEEEIVAEYFGANQELSPFPVDHNWFQRYENAADHLHVPILHSRISGDQFHDERFTAEMPQISWDYSAAGDSILTTTRRVLKDGQAYVRVEQGLIPNMLALPPFFWDGDCHVVEYFIPQDDVSYVSLTLTRKKKDVPLWEPGEAGGFGPERKLWRDMTTEEHQLYPNDYEAQASQGTITLHSEEHIAGSDLGVVKHRLLFKQQCRLVADGSDPVGVAFTEVERRIVIEARSWMEMVDEPVSEPA